MKSGNGFFKIPHNLKDMGVWRDAYAFKLLMYCLDNAAHNAHVFDGKRIDVGQFPTSYRKMSAELGWSISTLQKYLNVLETKYKEIEVRSFKDGTIIVVVNYKGYQNGVIGVPRGDTPCTETRYAGVPSDGTQVYRDTVLQKNDTEEENRRIYLATLEKDFSALWNAYPRQQNRKAGFAEYKRQITKGATHESVMTALMTAKESEQWRQDGGKYIPNIARWLSDETWRNHLNDNQEEGGNKWGSSY